MSEHTTMTDLEQLDAAALAALRSRGQRYTTGRRLLLHTLHQLNRPVTIPTILDTTPSLPQSSVYRNLAACAEAGLVQIIGSRTGEHAHYEMTGLAGVDNVAYRHCPTCHTVTAFPPTTAWLHARELVALAADDAPFTVAVFAACDECATTTGAAA